jgi:hypothetical protein
MAMTPYSGDTSVIGKLGTTPQERGLTTQQFKDKFDEGLKNFVQWFNETHIAEANTYLNTTMHRTIFRGANLGTSLTTAQRTAIQNGTFENLWLGDYWVINGVIWRIVDFDYWYNCGDTAFTNHHLVIMPDNALYNTQMNATNTTEGGYIGSLMYTEGLSQAKTLITSAFGDAVLTHREYLVNAVSNGKPSGGAWYDSSVELPNEIMMYGSYVFTPAADGQFITNRYTIGNSQLALMQQVPRFIKTRQNYWLRDVVSAAHFAVVDYYGRANYGNASNSYGVRPVFPIG